ncbi:unnamed protein product [Sphagnum jensenii]
MVRSQIHYLTTLDSTTDTESSCPLVPTDNFESVFVADAYRISPVVTELIPVPPPITEFTPRDKVVPIKSYFQKSASAEVDAPVGRADETEFTLIFPDESVDTGCKFPDGLTPAISVDDVGAVTPFVPTDAFELDPPPEPILASYSLAYYPKSFDVKMLVNVPEPLEFTY